MSRLGNAAITSRVSVQLRERVFSSGLVERVMPSLLMPEQVSVVGVAGACMVVVGALTVALGRSRALTSMRQ